MSATPLGDHPGRRRRRARARPRASGSTIIWRPIAVLAGQPDTAPWTRLADDGERTTFYAGPAAIELHRTETANYRDNLATGAPALWVVLRETGAEPPYALLPGDRRSGRGRGHDRGRQRHRRVGADAGSGPRPGCGVRRRTPCRAGVRQAQARPRQPRVRSGGVRRRREGTTNDRAGTISWTRWSRRKLEAAERRSTAAPSAADDAAARRKPRRPSRMRESKPAPTKATRRRQPEFDLTKLPSLESITGATDIRAFLAPGVPAELDPCGASPRVGGRSGDPRFRRAAGERLGLHRPERDAGLRRAAAGLPTSRSWWRRCSASREGADRRRASDQADDRGIDASRARSRRKSAAPARPAAAESSRLDDGDQAAPVAAADRVAVARPADDLCSAIILLRRTTVIPMMMPKQPKSPPRSTAVHCRNIESCP